MPRYISEGIHMTQPNEKNFKDTESTQGEHEAIDEYIDQKIEEYYHEFYTAKKEYYESLSEGKELGWPQVYTITQWWSIPNI